MVLTYTNLRFAGFSVLFVSVASAASVFIFPLLVVSLVCSGFVLFFTGLSYISFRAASSQYNHTVLFLNRILRNIADSIPPSVGYSEIKPLQLQTVTSLLPSLGLLNTAKSITSKFSSIVKKLFPFSSKSTEIITPQSEQLIQNAAESIELGPEARIIDDEGNVLDAYLEKQPNSSIEGLAIIEEKKEDSPLLGVPAEATDGIAYLSNEVDPVKLSELDHN